MLLVLYLSGVVSVSFIILNILPRAICSIEYKYDLVYEDQALDDRDTTHTVDKIVYCLQLCRLKVTCSALEFDAINKKCYLHRGPLAMKTRRNAVGVRVFAKSGRQWQPLLIVDSSFESDSDWWITETDIWPDTFSSAYAHTGNRSLRMQVSMPFVYKYILMKPRVLQAAFTVYSKYIGPTSSETDRNYGFEVVVGPPGEEDAWFAFNKTTAEWQKGTVHVYTGQALELLSPSMMFDDQIAGEVYYDDVAAYILYESDDQSMQYSSCPN